MGTRPYSRTEQVQTTLTPTWARRLDAYAEGQEVSRAKMIERFIIEGLEAAGAAPAPRRLGR